MTHALARHNGGVSFWYASTALPRRRAPLDGDRAADVCIVGGGFTGLWAAYYLKRARPELEVVVLEREFAGFGASGRNGGWLTSEFVVSREQVARDHGRDAVLALQRAMQGAVDEVIAVAGQEGIDADIVKHGLLHVARGPVQLQRIRQLLADDRHWGLTADDVRELSGEELARKLHVTRGSGALFSPHAARVHPAKLVQGLAAAVQRLGVTIYEGTTVSEVLPGGAGRARGIGASGLFPGGAGRGRGVGASEAVPGTAGAGAPAAPRAVISGVPASGVARAVTDRGTVTAPAVLVCLEGFTASLRGRRRDWVPLNSALVATEPLDDATWAEIGWAGSELLGDAAHAYMYAQRTADGRIAFGGRGVPYRFGSRTDVAGRTQQRTIDQLAALLREFFPVLERTTIDHAWCGVLGVPRDWTPTVRFDRASGIGTAGGYIGSGVATSNLAGRTLRDLVLGESSELTALPWVGRSPRRWEPEPLRFVGAQLVYGLYRAADRREAAGLRQTSRLASVASRLAGR